MISLKAVKQEILLNIIRIKNLALMIKIMISINKIALSIMNVDGGLMGVMLKSIILFIFLKSKLI